MEMHTPMTPRVASEPLSEPITVQVTPLQLSQSPTHYNYQCFASSRDGWWFQHTACQKPKSKWDNALNCRKGWLLERTQRVRPLFVRLARGSHASTTRGTWTQRPKSWPPFNISQTFLLQRFTLVTGQPAHGVQLISPPVPRWVEQDLETQGFPSGTVLVW